MCRSIKPLFNFEPPASDAEVRAAALQFVRKISGFAKPSKYNQAAFEAAVERIAASAQTLLGSLHTNAPLKDRETEIARAKLRALFRAEPLRVRGLSKAPRRRS